MKTDSLFQRIPGIETILVYKFPNQTREEIQQMIGLQDIEQKQTRFYSDVFSEGEQEGELTIILRLLIRRFGNLPVPLVLQLRQLDTEKLESFRELRRFPMNKLPKVEAATCRFYLV